jgi:hypothetical protein
MTTACFFTVCGAGGDYDFLLGSIEHHAKMGRHVVLDTTPPGRQRSFRFLPKSVIWIYEPTFGHGWKEFRCRSAISRAAAIARLFGDVVAYLDSDEYFERSLVNLFDRAREAPIDVQRVHWKRDGVPYRHGNREWHVRLWAAAEEVSFPVNEAWLRHPDYDGNPERHPVAVFRPGLLPVKVDGVYHHHVHHLLGEKALNDKTARETIPDWDEGTALTGFALPEKLAAWHELGVLPSESFI